jgi:hypothetical protein
MNRITPLLVCFAGDCLAHPGHGAPVVHAHGWDWGYWGLGIGMVVLVAALMIRRRK